MTAYIPMKHLGNLKDKLPKKTKSKKPTSAQTKIEKEKKKSSVIKLHAKVQRHLVGLPPYEKEVMFHPTRKWRMDYAWPDLKIAVEIHGGIFSGGRHTTGVGFIADREKMNEAQLLGWIVLELAPDHLDRMKDMVERAIALRGEQCIQ